jgi:hypothetical protein
MMPIAYVGQVVNLRRVVNPPFDAKTPLESAMVSVSKHRKAD